MEWVSLIMVTEGARTVSGLKKYSSVSPSPFKPSIAHKIHNVTNTIDIYHIKVLNTLKTLYPPKRLVILQRIPDRSLVSRLEKFLP